MIKITGWESGKYESPRCQGCGRHLFFFSRGLYYPCRWCDKV